MTQIFNGPVGLAAGRDVIVVRAGPDALSPDEQLLLQTYRENRAQAIGALLAMTGGELRRQPQRC